MKNYFIRYDPKAKVNYLYLFMLYGIAGYNPENRTFDSIYYRSIRDLSRTIQNKYGEEGFSYSTLKRILQDPNYKEYFHYGGHFVTLHNSFSNSKRTDNTSFIIISNKEADKLIELGDSSLASYYCYLKYYCGLATKIGKPQDFTAKQYLNAVGLSVDNHNNYSKVSSYNTILSNANMIKIDKFRDDMGNERNRYSIQSI